MQISSKFTISIHTLLCIEHFGKDTKVTSNFIAASTNVNSVIIRRILGELKEAEIVNVEAGVGGASIIKPLDKITMLDVFKATMKTKQLAFQKGEKLLALYISFFALLLLAISIT